MRIDRHSSMKRLVLVPAIALMTMASVSFAQTPKTATPKSTPAQTQTQNQQIPPQRGNARFEQWLNQEVNHQLLLLPWYSVYDNLQYKVNGSEVTLLGQVLEDRTKQQAEQRVKGIEGVTKVNNNVEILPASPNDDRIRRAEYRAIFGDPALEMYSFGSVQPVHIIVRGGHVTLEGSVLNEGHKNLINLRANGVSGVFSVTNNLRIENSKTEAEKGKS